MDQARAQRHQTVGRKGAQVLIRNMFIALDEVMARSNARRQAYATRSCHNSDTPKEKEDTRKQKTEKVQTLGTRCHKTHKQDNLWSNWLEPQWLRTNSVFHQRVLRSAKRGSTSSIPTAVDLISFHAFSSNVFGTQAPRLPP